MKGLEIFFPPFSTIVCDHVIKKYFSSHIPESKPKKISIGGYNVIVEKWLPKNSALFLDEDKNIVAIYLNGRLSFNKVKIKKLEVVFEWLKYKDELGGK